MATSPVDPPENRAPPPSPVAIGRKNSFVNEEKLTHYLERSLHLPELVLPDRFFPKENSGKTPPEIDLRQLSLCEKDSLSKLIGSVTTIGCFQLLNHGLSKELISAVKAECEGVFGLSHKKKMMVSRSNGVCYGFEEHSGEIEEYSGENEECSGEFFWSRRERTSMEFALKRVWPEGFRSFSQNIEALSAQIEKIAEFILQILLENTSKKASIEQGDSLLGLYKHGRNAFSGKTEACLKSDLVRILIRRSDLSHALSIHLCDGSPEFHVYSRKGWISFRPAHESVVFTVGDQIQKWSEGLYKHVVGRPMFKRDDGCMSMALLYSPTITLKGGGQKTISFAQQVLLAICLIFLYHLLVLLSKPKEIH